MMNGVGMFVSILGVFLVSFAAQNSDFNCVSLVVQSSKISRCARINSFRLRATYFYVERSSSRIREHDV
jgi:hypothetical protein